MAKKRVKIKASGVKEPGSAKNTGKFYKVRRKDIFLVLGLAVIVALLVILGGGSGKSIEQGSNVTLHYTGTLEDGTVFDSSRDKIPLEFIIGQGQIIKGFEDGIIGMKAGDKKTIHIASENAYGEYNPENIGEYPKENVPETMELQIGSNVFLEAPNGGIAIATVKEIKDETIILDMNHPLAGKARNFEVEILDVA